MHTYYRYFLCLLGVFSGFPPALLHAQQLLHYWNFNDNASVSALLTPSAGPVPGASIVHISGGASAVVTNGTGQDFDIANLNAKNGDPAGAHLRFNDPLGGALEFSLPTSGYENAIVRFSTRRSGQGAGLQYWSYSVNGSDFIPFDTVVVADGPPVLETFNFNALNSSVADNPLFKLRVSFAQGGGGTGGNNRFDNFTLEAFPLGGADSTPPSVTFDPADNAVNVAIAIAPVIRFSEPVRLIDDTPLSSANAASVVDLRTDNSAGAQIAFTASYVSGELTVFPAAPLQHNRSYYLALKANAVEDYNDNAVAASRAVVFTTIAEQTPFDAGDMLVVAYRMNASGAEDEIALLTLTDILPGTLVNITDAKYTTAAQPQCTGGLVWTAPSGECIPAGTVIYIRTDAVTSSIGSLSGSGFGLSSGGDQVIIYTGSAAAPVYVTAMSSNGWVSTNTSCGGSFSMIPAGLTDGQSALNLSNAPGNVSGNSVNAFYKGIQSGTAEQLKAAILDPANWEAAGGGTQPQQWPAFAFPASAAVKTAEIPSANSIRLVFNGPLDPVSALDINNYRGIPGLAGADMTGNDSVLLTFSVPFAGSMEYALEVNGIRNAAGEVMSCPFRFAFTYNTAISLAQNFMVAKEGDGTVFIDLNITHPAAATVDLKVWPAPYSTADTFDFVLPSHTVTIDGSATQVRIPVEIKDDQQEEQHAEYFVVSIGNPSGCTVAGDSFLTFYITDNDRRAAHNATPLQMTYLGSFDPSGSATASCEVVTYDSLSARMFVSGAGEQKFYILDFSNPASPSVIGEADMSPYGGITSIAAFDGIVAVASPAANEQEDGSVVFFDTAGNYLTQVTVGALPDMIMYHAPLQMLLVANEGQPSADYAVDPEGSVSIIDVAGGVSALTQADVTTLDFTSFNADEESLIKSGVRKTQKSGTLSMDLEPEYIAAIGNKAWVTLQENNAIAEIDLQSKAVTDIWALGTRDMNATFSGFDASDNNGEVLIANWPVKAFYIPDGVAAFSHNGGNFLITANEGDEKEYQGLEERTTVGASGYKLDSIRFPNAELLKKSHNLGRMRVTNLDGDYDGDGDYDDIYCVGSRSFSIWSADTRSLVYDSGDDFERITLSQDSLGAIFNSDHEENRLKARSRAKGPEPEGVVVGKLDYATFAFICLERIGGVMAYDVTDPGLPQFAAYVNPRTVSSYGGDLGPETMTLIPGSHQGHKYLVVANEISGTLSVYDLRMHYGYGVGSNDTAGYHTPFNLFPNPARDVVYFNRTADIEIADASGKVIYRGSGQGSLNVAAYTPGIYFIRTGDGAMTKLVVAR